MKHASSVVGRTLERSPLYAALGWHPHEPIAPITQRIYLDVVRRDPCAYCGAAAVVLDHLVPRGRAGSDSWINLTAACWACNSGKAGRSLLAWLAFRGWVGQALRAARAQSAAWFGLGR